MNVGWRCGVGAQQQLDRNSYWGLAVRRLASMGAAPASRNGA
jgi:hypothetical protein